MSPPAAVFAAAMFIPSHGAGGKDNGAGKLTLPLSKPAKKLQDQAEKVSRVLAINQCLYEFSQLLHHLLDLSGSCDDGLSKRQSYEHILPAAPCLHITMQCGQATAYNATAQLTLLMPAMPWP